VIIRQEKMTNKAKSQMYKVRHEVKGINRKEKEKEKKKLKNPVLHEHVQIMPLIKGFIEHKYLPKFSDGWDYPRNHKMDHL